MQRTRKRTEGRKFDPAEKRAECPSGPSKAGDQTKRKEERYQNTLTGVLAARRNLVGSMKLYRKKLMKSDSPLKPGPGGDRKMRGAV